MADASEKIELRSEKVRNIIGQIPPRLMRIGIFVIFLVFIGVIMGTYLFEYEYTIKTTASLTKQGDSIIVQILIPLNESNRIKKGQKLFLNFDKIPYMYGQQIITSLASISSTIQISSKGGYFLSECYLSENAHTEIGNSLKINGTVVVNAEIQTGKIRFFDRILEPILVLC